MRTSLIGRADELDLVADLLGAGTSVLVAGAAGVGKTRLAREALDRLEAAGRPTRRAAASRAASTVALGALAAILPPGLDEGLDRLDLMRRSVRAFEELGCVIFVDDANLLDDMSTALVHQAAVAGLPILLTVRTGTSVPELVTSLWKDGLAERLELQALAEAEVESLMADALGGPPSGETVKAVFTVTRGNPLFVVELVAAARRDGTLRDEGGVWRHAGPLRAPQHLAELVGVRVDQMAAHARSALETLAVAGELGVRSLEALCGIDAAAALDADGFIEIVTDRERKVARPAHPLFGEVVRDQLPPLRIATIQRMLAGEILRCGTRRDSDPVHAALWLLDADGTAPPDLLLRAANGAFRQFDSPLMVRLSRAALSAGGGGEAALRLGQALSDIGRSDEADQILGGVAIAALENDSLRVRLGGARAHNLGVRLGRLDDARRVLDEVRVHTSSESGYADGQQATLELFAGRLEEAVALAQRARGLSGGEYLAYYPLAMSMAIGGPSGDALDLVATAPDDPEVARAIGVPHIIALTALGRLDEAIAAALDGYRRSVDEWGSESVATFALLLGRAEIARGHVVSALRWFREAAAVNRGINDVVALRWSLGGLAAASGMAGDVSGSRAAVAELDRLPPGGVQLMEPDMIPLGRAWASAASAELGRARAELEGAVPLARATGQAIFEARLLREHRRLGGSGDPAREVELAERIGGDLVAQWNAPRDAKSQLAAAERLNELGAHLDAAEAALVAASAAREEGLRRVGEAATRLSSDAFARCEGARTPALATAAAPTRLTAREHEVAALAASGWTSRRIADHLVVSIRTVENHLQRAYEKLGVRGREELARALSP